MSLDPRTIGTLYWTAAWVNMLAIVVVAIVGVRQIPRAAYGTHKRLMLTACTLVGLFVASYAVKLVLLGREALEEWEPSYLYVLRLHELCVLGMLVGGGIAVSQAYRLGMPGAPMNATPEASAAWNRGVRLHRRAGFAALISAALGVATAAYVLQGMYARL